MLKNKVVSFSWLIISLFLTTFLTAENSRADADCSSATVTMVGVALLGGETLTKLELINETSYTVGGTWASKTPRQFFLAPTIAKEGLATMLTAKVTNSKVWVRISGDAAVNSLVTVIYMR